MLAVVDLRSYYIGQCPRQQRDTYRCHIAPSLRTLAKTEEQVTRLRRGGALAYGLRERELA